MAQARGSQSTVALFEEDTYGSDPSVPDGQLVYFSSFGPAKSQNRIDSNVITGDRERVEPFLGNVSVSGPKTPKPHCFVIKTLYKQCFSSPFL